MTSDRRLIDAATVSLTPCELEPGQVVAGSPRTAVARFDDVGTTEVGVWEHTVGTSSDVEVDEVFLVIAGRGTVTFADGETVELRPGSLVRLHEGERTVWEIEETLRKIYIA